MLFYFIFTECNFSGRIVCDSDHFHTKQFIWPEGYTAFRIFKSTKGTINPICLAQFLSVYSKSD